MKKQISLCLLSTLLIFSINEAFGQINPDRQWPSYRGNFSAGVLDNTNLPETFDIGNMTNVKWKTEIPGLGLSSPVIWDNKIFITSAISQADRDGFKPGIYGDISPVRDSSVHEWKVYCIDKNTGKIIWEKTSYKGIPKMKPIRIGIIGVGQIGKHHLQNYAKIAGAPPANASLIGVYASSFTVTFSSVAGRAICSESDLTAGDIPRRFCSV